MATQLIALLLWLSSTSLCVPTTGHNRPKPDVGLPLSAETVAQLHTVPTWLENIAVRENGDLLVTQLRPTPVLYTIKNPTSKNATLDPIYEWHEPNAAVLAGVTETSLDTFVIITGNATANATGYVGTFSVWEAKFHSLESSKLSVRKVVDVPKAKFLNGIVALPEHPEIVLIADSQAGLLFRLDTRTGRTEVIADRPEFKPYPEIYQGPAFGINGVKIRDGYLYFSNSNLVAVYRVPITKEGYIARKGKASIELYANFTVIGAIFIDDFTFKDDGSLWATSNIGNIVAAVSVDGKSIKQVAGAEDQLTLASDTAAEFGRTKADRDILYVVTAGGLSAPVNGTAVEPGKVVAVDTT